MVDVYASCPFLPHRTTIAAMTINLKSVTSFLTLINVLHVLACDGHSHSDVHVHTRRSDPAGGNGLIAIPSVPLIWGDVSQVKESERD